MRGRQEVQKQARLLSSPWEVIAEQESFGHGEIQVKRAKHAKVLQSATEKPTKEPMTIDPQPPTAQ